MSKRIKVAIIGMAAIMIAAVLAWMIGPAIVHWFTARTDGFLLQND